MSPEQLQDGDANGQGYLGTAVDVWAAGVLLIVMLLGALPAAGAACRALAYRRRIVCVSQPRSWRLCCAVIYWRVVHGVALLHSTLRWGGRRAGLTVGCVTLSGYLRSGTFPFDHTENPDPNCKEAHTEVWAQQTKGSWSEVPHIKKAVQKVCALPPALLPQAGLLASGNVCFWSLHHELLLDECFARGSS